MNIIIMQYVALYINLHTVSTMFYGILYSEMKIIKTKYHFAHLSLTRDFTLPDFPQLC